MCVENEDSIIHVINRFGGFGVFNFEATLEIETVLRLPQFIIKRSPGTYTRPSPAAIYR
jgi:hypothetical protein